MSYFQFSQPNVARDGQSVVRPTPPKFYPSLLFEIVAKEVHLLHLPICVSRIYRGFQPGKRRKEILVTDPRSEDWNAKARIWCKAREVP